MSLLRNLKPFMSIHNTLNKIIYALSGLIIIIIIFGISFGSFFYIERKKQKAQFNLQSVPVGQTQNNNETAVKDLKDLSSDEVSALQSIGIDPTKVSGEITVETQKCFVNKLGITRIVELSGGKFQPTWDDVNKIKECLN